MSSVGSIISLFSISGSACSNFFLKLGCRPFRGQQHGTDLLSKARIETKEMVDWSDRPFELRSFKLRHQVIGIPININCRVGRSLFLTLSPDPHHTTQNTILHVFGHNYVYASLLFS